MILSKVLHALITPRLDHCNRHDMKMHLEMVQKYQSVQNAGGGEATIQDWLQELNHSQAERFALATHVSGHNSQ